MIDVIVDIEIIFFCFLKADFVFMVTNLLFKRHAHAILLSPRRRASSH